MEIMLNRYTDAFDIVNFEGSVYILQRSAETLVQIIDNIPYFGIANCRV